MATLTYCKGLPTPSDEMSSLGFTNLEMFLNSFAPVFRKATCCTVDHLLSASVVDPKPAARLMLKAFTSFRCGFAQGQQIELEYLPSAVLWHLQASRQWSN